MPTRLECLPGLSGSTGRAFHYTGVQIIFNVVDVIAFDVHDIAQRHLGVFAASDGDGPESAAPIENHELPPRVLFQHGFQRVFFQFVPGKRGMAKVDSFRFDFGFFIVDAVFHPLFHRFDSADGADARQSSQPVGKKDNEKNHEDQGKEAAPRVTCASGNAVGRRIEELDDHLNDVLETCRDFPHPASRKP